MWVDHAEVIEVDHRVRPNRTHAAGPPGETRWDEYYVANAAAVEKGEWSIEQGVSGTAWNGALYDVDDTLIALDNFQAYSVAPFAVEYYSDVARGGGVDAMAEAQRRMSFRIPEAIAEAEALAG